MGLEVKILYCLLEFDFNSMGFKCNEDNFLFFDVVIVDEFFMLDLFLVYFFFKVIFFNI